MTRRQGPPDFRRVTPTPEEVAEYRASHHGSLNPAVYRVQCRYCAKRIWGSGIGIGAHRKKCDHHVERISYLLTGLLAGRIVVA